jgi:hypothetical protein
VLADSSALVELLPLLRNDRFALAAAEYVARLAASPRDASSLSLPTEDPVAGLVQTHLNGLRLGLLQSSQTGDPIHAPA